MWRIWGLKNVQLQICLKLPAGMAVLVVLHGKKEAKSQHVFKIQKTMTAGFIFFEEKKKKKAQYKADRFMTETKGTGRQPSCADTAVKKTLELAN